MKAKAVTPDNEARRHHAAERIFMGNPYELSTRMSGEPNSAPSLYLTPRQLEVLSLLCEGLPNKLISRRLNISGCTVKIHISSILRALNVSSRLQAVVAARRVALVREPAPETENEHMSSPAGQPALLHLVLDRNAAGC
jgi:DNA-binding NarL/FixJ family response regulator